MERDRHRPPRRTGRGGIAAAIAALAVALALLAFALPSGSGSRTPADRETAEVGVSDAGSMPVPAIGSPDGANRAGGGGRSGERGEQRRGRPIEWRHSKAVGLPHAGELRRGVLLPRAGRHWISWDPIEERTPSRQWRRWGTDRLVRTTLAVLRDFGAEHRRASRVPIGDLSRPRGGDFGPQYGALGHASHQNGLDVDVYYPRRDGRERPPERPGQVDVGLAQDLVDRFVAAGAEKVFVGPSLPLRGPADVVVPLVHHDDHLHARLPG